LAGAAGLEGGDRAGERSGEKKKTEKIAPLEDVELPKQNTCRFEHYKLEAVLTLLSGY
jgi:hypothetical protein